MDFRLREPTVDDAPATARVRHDGWRATYVLPPEAWERFTLEHFVSRDRMWLSSYVEQVASGGSERVARVAVDAHGAIVGVGVSGPPMTTPVAAERMVYSLYVAPAAHGLGIGSALLAAIAPPLVPTVVRVADPNPRAQAFYRRHGFEPRGERMWDAEIGLWEILMLRE